MKKVKVFVNYCDIEFEVKGYYCKADFYDYSDSYIEDVDIFIEGINVMEILNYKQIDAIAELAVEKLED